jgi:protein-tyrosine phosphatase
MFNFFKKSPTHFGFDWLATDMHSHLLPGLDDGSPDVETSVSHIAALRELGFSKFICTPHIFMEMYPNTRETITSSLNLLNAHPYIKDNGIEILAAAEYMVNADFGPLFKAGNMVTLPGNYLLIEMSYLAETPDIEKYVFDLCIKGYKPILAHPERYNFYHQKPEKIMRLKDMGCLLQLNLLAVTGYYGKEVKQLALTLLKQNAYDLSATDFHHHNHLKTFQKVELWKPVHDQVSKYPFKNKLLFG